MMRFHTRTLSVTPLTVCVRALAPLLTVASPRWVSYRPPPWAQLAAVQQGSKSLGASMPSSSGPDEVRWVEAAWTANRPRADKGQGRRLNKRTQAHAMCRILIAYQNWSCQHRWEVIKNIFQVSVINLGIFCIQLFTFTPKMCTAVFLPHYIEKKTHFLLFCCG